MRVAFVIAAALLGAAVALQSGALRAAADVSLKCQSVVLSDVNRPSSHAAPLAASLCDVLTSQRCTKDCTLQTRNVLRSFHNVSSPWSSAKSKFKLSGHVAAAWVRQLPDSSSAAAWVASSLTVLPPLHGCGSGRGNTIPELASAFASRRHYFVALSESEQGGVSQARGVFVTSSTFGCHVAINGNLFATDSFRCHGNIVSSGRVIHRGSNRVAHFGLLSSRVQPGDNSSVVTAMTGYLSEAEGAQLDAAAAAQVQAKARLREFIRGGLHLNASELRQAVAAVWPGAVGHEQTAANSSASALQPFAQLIPGLIWLVRDGASFVATGVPQAFEDTAAQETGSAAVFVDVASARTAVGLDGNGRIVIAQVDGRSDWAGLDLRSFANWLVQDLKLRQAINLDGGASATWVRDGAVVANVPSYSCLAAGAVPIGRRAVMMGPQAQAARALQPQPQEQAQEQAGARAGPGRKAATPSQDDPNFRCLRPVSAGLCMHDLPPKPQLADVRHDGYDGADPSKDSELHRVIDVRDGCVCFHEALTPVAGESEGSGSAADGFTAAGYDAFTWDEAAAMFRVQSGPVLETDAAAEAGPLTRLLKLGRGSEARPWSELLAEAGLTDPLLQVQDGLHGTSGAPAGARRAVASADSQPIHLWPPEPYLTLHARVAAAAWLRALPGSLRRRVVLHSDPKCVCSAAGAAHGCAATGAHLTLHRHAFNARLAAWHDALRELLSLAAAEPREVDVADASLESALAAAWPAYEGEQDEVAYPVDMETAVDPGSLPSLPSRHSQSHVLLGLRGSSSLSLLADGGAVAIIALAVAVAAAVIVHRRRRLRLLPS